LMVLTFVGDSTTTKGLLTVYPRICSVYTQRRI
jgi:hypothetical protein